MRVNDTIPAPGTVIDWDIAEIMERESIDLDCYQSWDDMLSCKRGDHYYNDVKASIERWGFVRPLTAHTMNGELQFGDGHHRLAAAIELGMTTVPVLVFDFPMVATDSGSWMGKESVDSIAAVEYC
jgi:hypothetical protein